MVKVFAIALAVASSSLPISSLAQSKAPQKTEKEILDLLCHKWQLVYMEGQGKRMVFTPEMGKATVTFKSDGTLVETQEGQRFTGKWTYQHKIMTLFIDDKDGKDKQKIVKITPTQLVLNEKYQGILMNVGMKRVD